VALKPVPGRGVFEWFRVGYDYLPGVMQEQRAECGLACIGLVLHMKDHKEAGMMTIEKLRERSRALPLGYDPLNGTSPDNLVSMLHSYGYKKSRTGCYPQIRKMLRMTSLDLPLIVSVYFPEKHFVVACGYRSETKEYLFSDPAYGVGTMKLEGHKLHENFYRYAIPGQDGGLRGFYITVQ
jgi:ABC-type bacteriocin/lantibiotic exporter with double-glycine peptidase domain